MFKVQGAPTGRRLREGQGRRAGAAGAACCSSGCSPRRGGGGALAGAREGEAAGGRRARGEARLAGAMRSAIRGAQSGPRIPRRTRDPHARPLLLRPTQASALLQPGRAGCRRGRGGRWARRGRHVLHGIGSRRSDRKAGRSPRQVASAGAGAVLSLPTARCWRARGALPVQARAGTGAQGADVTSLVGTSCQLFSSHARSIGAPTSTLASPAPVPEV